MTKVKCLNKSCIYHENEDVCSKEEIRLGTQGVCEI